MKKLNAYLVFFPVAAIYAAIAIPLSLYARSHGGTLMPGLIGIHHGHEMLFGFALALIAGYLLGVVPRKRLALLAGLWLVARISYLLGPDSLIANLSSPAFAVLLAWWVAPKFLVAKKWRNQMLTPLLIVICACPLVFVIVRYLLDAGMLQHLMYAMVLLLALLMSYMGGRMIAPAVAGELYKQGINLAARVQPRIEGSIILLLSLAVLLLAVLPTTLPSGIIAVTTAILLLIRLFRWRLWLCLQRPDLIGLGIGYGWLATGLCLFGMALLFDRYHTAALHVITVGAIGSLSTSIILRIHFQRSQRQLPATALVMITIAAIAVATICRSMAGLSDEYAETLMNTAAAAWSIAFLSVASQFLPRTRV